MNEREQSIFMRGIAVGMRAAQEFEVDLEKEERIKVEKKKVTKIAKRMFGKKSKGKRGAKKLWTPEEDSFLRFNQDMSTTELAENLEGRSESSINQRRFKLGIKGKETKKEYSEGIAKLGQDEETGEQVR